MPAKSKSQARLFGMVYAYKKGNLKKADVDDEELWKSIVTMAKTVKDKDAKDFAGTTNYKDLPDKVKHEQIIRKIRQIVREEIQLENKKHYANWK